MWPIAQIIQYLNFLFPPTISIKSYSQLISFLANAGSTPCQISIAGNIVLASNTVIPSNIAITEIKYPFSFSGLRTLSIANMPARPLHQIFATTVSVTFSLNAVRFADLLWWGGGGPAKNKLLTACACGGILFFDNVDTNDKCQLKFINTTGTLLTVTQYDPLEA